MTASRFTIAEYEAELIGDLGLQVLAMALDERASTAVDPQTADELRRLLGAAGAVPPVAAAEPPDAQDDEIVAKLRAVLDRDR